MKRTNIVIDERLVGRVKNIMGVPTVREAVNSALHDYVRKNDNRRILADWGSGWEGDLKTMRQARRFR